MTKKSAVPIILLGGAAIGLWLFARSKAIQQAIKFFEYKLHSLKLKWTNILKPEIIVAVKVKNPNHVAIPITSFNGTISGAGTVLATWASYEDIHIGAGEEKLVQLSAKVNALSVISNIINKKSFIKTQVEGLLNTPLFSLPVKATIDLGATGITGINGVEDMEEYSDEMAVGFLGRKYRRRFHKRFGFLKRLNPTPIQKSAVPATQPAQVKFNSYAELQAENAKRMQQGLSLIPIPWELQPKIKGTLN
mgnify:CR=1 FL=1